MHFFKDKKFVILFMAACLLNAIPVLFNLFVLTLDGPSHIYNSNLILELFKGNPAIGNYISFNDTHLTNWSGHLILVLLKLIAPGLMVHKVFLIFLILSFPLSFAFMVNKLNYNSRYLSFIIFPFSYSRFFFLGFYNFLLGIIFFFLWVAFTLKEKPFYTIKEKVLIFVLFVLMECSHVFVFVIAAAIFFGYLMIPVFKKNKFRLFAALKDAIGPLFNFFALISGGLILFLFYYFNNTGQIMVTAEIALPWEKIIIDIIKIAPILSLSEYNSTFNLVFFIMLVLTVVFLFFKKYNPEKRPKSCFILFSALIILCLYVITMRLFENGIYVQIRLLFLFFLLLLIWIVLQKVPKSVQICLIICSLFLSSLFVNYYQKTLSGLSMRCYYIYDMGNKIDRNARVYCMNFSNHWLDNHLLGYLGAENPIILYDNYECSQPYFPLKWKNPEMIRTIATDFDNGLYTEIISEHVDYVAILDNPSKEQEFEKNKSLKLVKEYYYKVLVSEDKRLTIYKKTEKN